MWACCKPCYAKTTVRMPTAIMIFLACFVMYSVRLTLNMAMIAMVYPPNVKDGGPECDPDSSQDANATNDAPDFGPRQNWSSTVQGHVKAAYGYGYCVAHFPGGFLADLIGPRCLVTLSLVIQGTLTVLVPLASGLHWGIVFVLRLFIGLAGGVMFPSLHTLVAHWAPPHEKGKFIFALMGGSFSAVVTMLLSGVIIETLNWAAFFYLTTGATALVCGVWLLIVHNSPTTHPAISEDERNYILESQGDAVKTKKPPIPLKRVLASVPFWALVVLHYGELWGLFLLTTDTPIFLHDVLGFSLIETGGINALPTLGRCIMSFVFGSIVDHLVGRGLWKNKGRMRKVFVIFSHLMPGALMLGLAFVGCNWESAVTLLSLGLTINGASTVTNLVNHHDLAPNYAGSLYGFMSGIGTTTLFIVPSLDGVLLEEHNGPEEWRYIFIIGSCFYFVTGIVFIIFGSGEVQSWNDPEANPEQKPNEQAPPS